MKATLLLKLGKEFQDLIQAWVDPEMTKGKLSEARELASALWNLQERYPGIKAHMKEFIALVATGAQLETIKEYSGDWVEWDLEPY